jgi:FkbM family methyltransferase
MIEDYLRQIQNDGLVIKTVYDIGAFIGQWTMPLKNSCLQNSEFYLFEGNAEYASALFSTGCSFYTGILSSPSKPFVDYYKKNSTGDSYYRENSIHYDNQIPVQMPTRTLDSVVKEYNLPVPNLLKIDTQGSELDILDGATDLLPNVDLVYLECPFVRYNLGAPNLQDYLDFMRNKGFVPTKILEIHYSENVILQIDIMFINYETKKRLYGENLYSRPLEK